MISRKNILLTTALTAIAARVAVALTVFFSPYRFFYCVPGLDMETLLAYADWEKFPVLLVPYRLFLSLMHCLGTDVFAIYCLQALCGVAGAVMVADMALYFCRRRGAALFAGIVFACYAPFWMYEFAVLQESFLLNFILSGVYLLFIAAKKHFPVGWTAAAAAVIAAASLGRPAALLLTGMMWFWILFFQNRRAGVFFGLTAAAVLGAGSIFNFLSAGTFSPFFQVTAFIVSSNEAALPDGGVNIPGLMIKVFGRIPEIFSARSIAENLNFHFTAERLPLLAVGFRPEGVIPLGIAGAILMLISEKTRMRALILLAVIAALTVPIAFRPAMERYQLLLMPYIIIFAAAAVAWFLSEKHWQERCAGVLLAVICAVAAFYLSPRPKLRPDDYTNWGIAARAGGFINDSNRSFYEGWEKFHSRPCAINIFRNKMSARAAGEAAEFAKQYLQSCPDDELFYIYFAGAAAASGEVDDAVTFLKKHPLTPESPFYDRYCRMLMILQKGASE